MNKPASVYLLQEAIDDLEEIIAFYEEEKPGLGKRFLQAYFSW
jgi:hypothetical protein